MSEAFALCAIVYGFRRRTDETGVKTMSRLMKVRLRNVLGGVTCDMSNVALLLVGGWACHVYITDTFVAAG